MKKRTLLIVSFTLMVVLLAVSVTFAATAPVKNVQVSGGSLQITDQKLDVVFTELFGCAASQQFAFLRFNGTNVGQTVGAASTLTLNITGVVAGSPASTESLVVLPIVDDTWDENDVTTARNEVLAGPTPIFTTPGFPTTGNLVVTGQALADHINANGGDGEISFAFAMTGCPPTAGFVPNASTVVIEPALVRGPESPNAPAAPPALALFTPTNVALQGTQASGPASSSAMIAVVAVLMLVAVTAFVVVSRKSEETA